MKVLVAQLGLTLCNPMDCILQARTFPSPGELPDSGIKLRSPTLGQRFLSVYWLIYCKILELYLAHVKHSKYTY